MGGINFLVYVTSKRAGDTEKGEQSPRRKQKCVFHELRLAYLANKNRGLPVQCELQITQ